MDNATATILLASTTDGDITMTELIVIYFFIGFGLVWICNDPINGFEFSEKKYKRIAQRLALLFLWPLLLLCVLVRMIVQ